MFEHRSVGCVKLCVFVFVFVFVFVCVSCAASPTACLLQVWLPRYELRRCSLVCAFLLFGRVMLSLFAVG